MYGKVVEESNERSKVKPDVIEDFLEAMKPKVLSWNGIEANCSKLAKWMLEKHWKKHFECLSYAFC
jgi:hypothetical protein